MLLAKNGHPLPLSGSRRWYSHRPTVSRGRLPTTPAHHKPSDATSRLVLKALASAIDVYPPLSRGHPSSFCAPLKFKLLVEPRVPTLAEFRALADLRARIGPPTPRSSRRWGQDLAALAWPIIVDWEHEESSVGGVTYTRIPEAVAERRHKGHLFIVQDPSAPWGRRSQS
ncbi:hypothetical protein B0H17DRAFT_1220573 [Mycena rosella]|uniref:Uncharacterized protein n=1 Tax=Mycena rosella TaxID=1033263 RepID=A0AAD7B9G0_MYCRO|nr:hypothetical protein B0H17DRAFT_1220573 [Mycena rosella]